MSIEYDGRVNINELIDSRLLRGKTEVFVVPGQLVKQVTRFSVDELRALASGGIIIGSTARTIAAELHDADGRFQTSPYRRLIGLRDPSQEWRKSFYDRPDVDVLVDTLPSNVTCPSTSRAYPDRQHGRDVVNGIYIDYITPGLVNGRVVDPESWQLLYPVTGFDMSYLRFNKDGTPEIVDPLGIFARLSCLDEQSLVKVDAINPLLKQYIPHMPPMSVIKQAIIASAHHDVSPSFVDIFFDPVQNAIVKLKDHPHATFQVRQLVEKLFRTKTLNQVGLIEAMNAVGVLSFVKECLKREHSDNQTIIDCFGL